MDLKLAGFSLDSMVVTVDMQTLYFGTPLKSMVLLIFLLSYVYLESMRMTQDAEIDTPLKKSVGRKWSFNLLHLTILICFRHT